MTSLPAILLVYVVGMALIFLEMFVPGGMLGLIGGGLVVFAIVATFANHSVWYGVGFLVFSLVAVVFTLLFFLRRITLKDQQSESEYRAAEAGLDALLGEEGVALTVLRPAGMARLAGRKVDVVSENQVVDKDARVKVVLVEGNRVVVRPVVDS